MSNLLSHATESEIEYRFLDNLIPTQVTFVDNAPNTLQLSNGEEIASPCLNCSAKPCLYFDESTHSNIVDVVFSEDVCPTNALYLDESEQVMVDSDSCIGCGLCAFRCKTGAIYLANNKAVIHRDVTHLFEGKLPETEVKYNGSVINNLEQKTMELISIIHESKKSGVVTNNLIKSSFMSLGFKVIKPRVGDVNLRMDLIIDTNQKLYLVEIDGLGSPDTIRDVIDDVAIFCDKYNRKLDSLAGVSCLLEFPNKRSEYYELISDAESVLKFNIYSISLGVILAALFNRKYLNIDLFSINEKQTSCRTALETILESNCGFNGKSSLIEAAK